MYQAWRSLTLYKRVLIGLVFGMLGGLVLRYALPLPDFQVEINDETVSMPGSEYIGTYWIYPFGNAFVRLIKMLIIPLVVTTLVTGVTAMGDPKKLGSLGLRAISLYIGTTFIAVSLGLVMGTLFRPGIGVDYESADSVSIRSIEDKLGQGRSGGTISDRILDIIPENPVRSIADGDLLPTIFFAIMIGLGILHAGEAADPVKRFFDSASSVVMQITLLILELSPYGVAALMAWVMSTKGIGILSSLLSLTAALYLSCFLQIVLVYGLLIVKGGLRLPARAFFAGIADAQGLAFSTASSSATLPMSISCAEKNLGIEKSVAGSVLPLGATVNMDGTAIYLGLIALFAAQACGIEVSIEQYVTVAFLATLVSIGAAGIPSAALMFAAGVIDVMGVTPEQSVMIIAFIFPFDRILDMMRTMTNVTGDLAVASAVARWQGALDDDVFRDD